MRTMPALMLTLTVCTAAHADFSYTQKVKNTGGMLGGMAGSNADTTSKISLKGQMMKRETGSTSTILDFENQTITTINKTTQTYTVKPFSEMAASTNGATATVDLRETGQKKMVNGYNASESILTMQVDVPQAQQLGRMQMEMDMWTSPDVPGYSDMRAFYERNAEKFPWSAMADGNNPKLAASMADLQKKIASIPGVQVEGVMKIKPAGGNALASAQQGAQLQGAMEQVRAKLEAMKAQGGPAGAIATKQLEKMGPAPAAGSDAGGALLQMTIDSSDFSSASIPDSVFAIPAGFQKK